MNRLIIKYCKNVKISTSHCDLVLDGAAPLPLRLVHCNIKERSDHTEYEKLQSECNSSNSVKHHKKLETIHVSVVADDTRNI